MGYRSIKRALGETNIERKCRVLFGICLGTLVCGAFLWVDTISEGLVQKTNEQIGRDYVNVSLLAVHQRVWGNEKMKRFVEASTKDLLGQDFEHTVLSLGHDEIPAKHLPVRESQSDKERELLEGLRKKWLEHVKELDDGPELEPEIPPIDESGVPAAADLKDTRVFETRTPDTNGKYAYYQPVYWYESCVDCHSAIVGAFSAADTAAYSGGTAQPFRVVKVSLPYELTQKALIETRAVLIAAAILMIFLAMVALYVIVRYVIVKPLKHLRDVSDAVSRGDNELRAEICTNDEFEDLADAFNRMLQHLIEVQGELRHVNTDLDAKVDELAQVNMRLYEMNRLKSDFLANMSHELRTPLNSIIGFSEVLQGIDSLTDRQKRYAHNIQKSGRVLLEMINDILDLAKLEAGKMELRPAEFRIETVVSAQCDMVRPLSEEKNIDLEVRASSDQPMVFQDQTKIQQILTNLLSNAIKFTPEGGRITVSVNRTENDELVLSVSDTGVGIPEEDREIIFEKFRQSKAVLGNDGLTREFSGTGLGLSIVKELCKLLGGEIAFTSELGRGSDFTVTVPWTLKHGSTLGAQMSRQLESMSRPQPADFQSDGATVPSPASVDSGVSQ